MIRSDTHRHLGGSIRPSTILQILDKQCPHHNMSLEKITRDMTYADDRRYDFKHFLDKFKILDIIQWDEWSIQKTIEQVCWDIARESIQYCELKFSINKYVKHTGWPISQVIKLINNLVATECEKWDIEIALILSLKYEHNKQEQLNMAKCIDDPDVVEILSGIDLVGDESCYSWEFYKPIFNEWRKAGKSLVAHVGESQSVDNVRTAIEELGVERIAHGIRIIDSPDIMRLAKERGTCFDVAITSNIYTGVVNNVNTHPVIKMCEYGLNVTIGTDDPIVLDTTLDQEYQKFMLITGSGQENLSTIIHNSLKFAANRTIAKSYP